MEHIPLEQWEKLLGTNSIVFEKTIDDGSTFLKALMDIHVPHEENAKILQKRTVELEIKSNRKGEVYADLSGGTLHMSRVCPDLAIEYFLIERNCHYTLH